MNREDAEVLMKGIAPVLREYVASQTAPLVARIEALENQVKTLESPAIKDSLPQALDVKDHLRSRLRTGEGS